MRRPRRGRREPRRLDKMEGAPQQPVERVGSDSPEMEYHRSLLYRRGVWSAGAHRVLRGGRPVLEAAVHENRGVLQILIVGHAKDGRNQRLVAIRIRAASAGMGPEGERARHEQQGAVAPSTEPVGSANHRHGPGSRFRAPSHSERATPFGPPRLGPGHRDSDSRSGQEFRRHNSFSPSSGARR